MTYKTRLEEMLMMETSAISVRMNYEKAALYRSQNSIPLAHIAAKECLVASLQHFGDTHPITFMVRFFNVLIDVESDDLEEADLNFTQLINALTFSIASNLPNGDDRAAELLGLFFSTILSDAQLEALLKRFDSEDSNLKSISNLGSELMNNSPKQAYYLLKAVFDARTFTKGSEDEATLLAAHKFAVLLSILGDHKLAKPILETNYKQRLKVHGFSHTLTLRSAGAYAGVLFATGSKVEALLLQQQVYGTAVIINGCDHPQTVIAAKNLLDMQKHV